MLITISKHDMEKTDESYKPQAYTIIIQTTVTYRIYLRCNSITLHIIQENGKDQFKQQYLQMFVEPQLNFVFCKYNMV